MISDLETYWSRELKSDVEIIPTREGKYSVYFDRTYYSEYPTLPVLEDALGKIYMLQEMDGY